jgi:integrase
MTWRPKRRETAGKVKWVARYRDPVTGLERIAKPAWNGGKGTFDLKREAQRAIDEAVTHRTPDHASSVETYLKRWLRDRPRSVRTDRTNKSRVTAVLDLELEGIPFRAWDMRDLRRRHRDELAGLMLTRQHRAPGGVRDVLRTLSAMFEDAMTDEVCDMNPWVGAKVRDSDQRSVKHGRKPRVWALEQMHEFAAAAAYRPKFRGDVPPVPRPAPQYTPMLRVMADCGPRIGEVFAMKRSGLMLATGQLEVCGTGWEGQVIGSSDEKEHDRLLPVPPGCLELLRGMPPRIDTLVLFPTPTGRMWRYSNFIACVWGPTCEVVGMDPTPHEFRHSWTTHLRAAGIDAADLALVAGHSVETATKVYTHALGRSDDLIREVIG